MIVDTHFHLWCLTHPTLRYSWLAPDATHRMLGSVAPLKRDHVIDEYMAAASASGVRKGVHVQCADPEPDPVAESAWLDGLADRHGFPHAIVAYADLGAPDVAEVLARHAAHARVRGVRDLDSSAIGETTTRRRRDGLTQLAKFALHYELRAVVHDSAQTDAAIELARAIPETTVVLTHAGLPLDRSPGYLEQWARNLRRLAEVENVVCKASGFGMGAYLTGKRCTRASVRDLLWECLDAFTPDRVMLGSNWPVDTLCWSLADAAASYRAALDGLTAAERGSVMETTASRVYRLE